MHGYTLNKVNQLGQHDEKFGTTYWAESNETLIPLMFNSMLKDIGAGQKIVAEEQETKYSKKNTEYLRLKKVRVVESDQSSPEKPAQGSSEPQSSTPAANIVMQLDRIEKKVDRLLGDEPLEPEKDEVHTVSDEPINLDDIPF